MRLPFPTILVCAVLGVPAAAAAQGDPPAPETAPAAVSEAVSGADETIPVIVDLVDLGVPSDAPAIAELLELQHDGVEATGVLAEFDLMAADVTPAGLAALEASSVVESVRPARDDLQLLLGESGTTTGAADLHLAGLTGAGRVVAVIDSGVDADHPALVGSVVAQGCFLDGVPGFSNDPAVRVIELCENGTRSDDSAEPCVTIPQSCTHGTAVAGVITADGPPLTGIAPDAGIIALRVTAVIEGLADESSPEYPYRAYIPEAGVLAALEEVYSLRNTFDIAAVNLSLGGSPGTCVNPVWEDVVDRLVDAGIAVVAASGNQGSSTSVSFPACLPGVVSVGASNDGGGVAPFSNTGPELDLLAPGSPVGTTVLTAYDASGFAEQHGTSFAAPHVAAAFVLLDERIPSGWPVERVRNLLRVTGEMIARPTSSPFDHDPRYPELRVTPLADFAPFDDAGSGYWVESADWAKVTGVSTGIGGNTFVPDGVLTRAQAVTFLWRFMGSPDRGTDSGFGDVAPGQWYGAAVAWAAATGVTTGTAPGVFSPDAPVSRGELATFMWRTAGEPPSSSNSGFVDVAGDAFYARAVNWMAENEVTTGTTPSTFAPRENVTRAQMVTFEFRLADAEQAWTGSVAPPELALF